MDDPVLDRRRRDALGTGRKEPFRPAGFIDQEGPPWMQAAEGRGHPGPVVAVGRSAQLEHDRVERGARKHINYWIEERIALARSCRCRDDLAIARRDEDKEPRRVRGESPEATIDPGPSDGRSDTD